MERRVLLAISLSFLVLFAYSRLVPPPAPEETAPAAAAPAPAGASAPSASPASGSPAQVAAQPASPAAAVVTGETVERDVVVETSQVRATFTNRGARLRHWVLKDYHDQLGQPLDLVPPADGATLPFSLQVDDQAQTSRLDDALFQVELNAPDRIDATTSPAVLSFAYESADGLRARKRFAFDPTGYRLGFTAEVSQSGQAQNPTILWGPGLGDEIAKSAGSGGFFSGNYRYPPEGFVHTNGSVTRYAGAKASTAGVQRGSFPFVGVDDHYFVSAVVKAPGTQTVTFASAPMPDPEGGTPRPFVSYAIKLDQAPKDLDFFIGPKRFDTLRAIDPEFTKVINFGMFSILAVPLLGALQWIHEFIGNYGWSIVTLTILINLAIWPLRHKSVVSMRKMQEIQPRMKAIQDRYAHLPMTDPGRAKMNEEVMALYREKGVNPVSGCLPMLLTLPVLFAFYSLLSQAIEIRGAPFMGWITDLSQRDPWYITPLLMGATMFWQQRLQPGTGDPVQQKVLMFMPVMFTVMFLGAPSGLVIYWFVSNLWAIGQQYFTNWMIGPAKATGGNR